MMNNNELSFSYAHQARRLALGVLFTLAGLSLTGCADKNQAPTDQGLKPDTTTEQKTEPTQAEPVELPPSMVSTREDETPKKEPPVWRNKYGYTLEELNDRPPWPPEAKKRDYNSPHSVALYAYDYENNDFVRDSEGRPMVDGLITPPISSQVHEGKEREQYLLFTKRVTLEEFWAGKWEIDTRIGALATVRDIKAALGNRLMQELLAKYGEPEALPELGLNLPFMDELLGKKQTSAGDDLAPKSEEPTYEKLPKTQMKPIVVKFCDAKKNVEDIVKNYMAVRPTEMMSVKVGGEVASFCIDKSY